MFHMENKTKATTDLLSSSSQSKHFSVFDTLWFVCTSGSSPAIVLGFQDLLPSG